MSHHCLDVPEARLWRPAPGDPGSASLPQLQIRRLAGVQFVISGLIHAPPIPESHSP
jgi:hypothetical protein